MIPILNVANQAVTMYRQYCPFTKNHGEYIFLGVRGNKLNPRSFQKIIEKARRANGLLNTTTPHSFRHSFATHLLNEDMDLRSIQKLLGHSSLSSTEVYTKVEQKKLIQVYKLTHPRERL
jgi:integrase/recombinase XerC